MRIVARHPSARVAPIEDHRHSSESAASMVGATGMIVPEPTIAISSFRHRLPSGGWIAAPGLILPAFSTKDVDPKSSGGSEERIGTAETDVVAAKKNAPQRAPNKAVFKPLPIFSSHNFKFTLKR